MKWSDDGIVLAITPFSEDQARLSLLTRTNGRQSGLFRISRRQAVLQLGDFVAATWNARLSEHLGRFQVERLDSPAPRMFQDSWRLWLLQNACGVMSILPERHSYSLIFEELRSFTRELTTLNDHIAFANMTLLEKLILAELGFGIDLSECCVTQQRANLTFISPKTGRAVSTEAAAPYRDKLLPLPAFWLGADWLDGEHATLNSAITPAANAATSLMHNPAWGEISNAFRVTHYFWQKWLFDDKQTFPAVRTSILGYCRKKYDALS
ncbi:MAG: DNA repair protein RecO [Pseudomonadota bacterium]